MYIALKRLRFGEARLEPGDEVPVEEGRNYNLLLRQGMIADLDSQVKTEADAAEQAKGYKARIKQLEGALEDAQKEIATLRDGQAADAEKSDGKDAEKDPEKDEAKLDLKRMNRDQLNAHAKSLGIDGAEELGNKADVMKAIKSAGK